MTDSSWSDLQRTKQFLNYHGTCTKTKITFDAKLLHLHLIHLVSMTSQSTNTDLIGIISRFVEISNPFMLTSALIKTIAQMTLRVIIIISTFTKTSLIARKMIVKVIFCTFTDERVVIVMTTRKIDIITFTYR